MDESFTPPCEPGERWLPVVEYEGLYKVSDLGRVWGVRRKGAAGALLKPARQSAHSWAHTTVALCRDGEQRSRLVHQLVLEAFVSPRPLGMDALHGPGGALDNRLVNLSWGTPSKNMGPDKIRDGTIPWGERSASAKLTAETVMECRRRYAAGESQRALAREFGVHQSTVSLAITGVNWAHLEPPAA